jgi:hypothetical protein
VIGFAIVNAFHDAFAPVSWSNWALVLVGVVAACLAWRILRRIEDQAKSGKEAATAALQNAQAVMNGERAWILAELSCEGDRVQTSEIQAELPGEEGPCETTVVSNLWLTCRNHGKTPGWIDEIRAQVDIVDANSVRLDPVLRKGSLGLMGPVAADDEVSTGMELRCKGRRQRDDFLSVFVVISYRDIFGSTHKTTLGYTIEKGQLLLLRAAKQRNRNT